MKKRVVITGIGLITPLGIGKEKYWDAVKNGESGINEVSSFDASSYTTKVAGEVKDFVPGDHLNRKEAKRMDRFTQFAVAAGKMAAVDAELDLEKEDKDRIGVILGTGIGGVETLEKQHSVLMEKGPIRVSPFFVPMMICNIAAGQLSIHLGLKGPNETIVNACASATNAIGEAYNTLIRGDADVVFSGGSEAAVTPLSMAGFCSMRAMTTQNEEPKKASKPFDINRDGFVLSEGAGIIVMETLDRAISRGANIYAEVSGYGCTGDAYHVTAPAPEGVGALRSMERAIMNADLKPEDVDYINAHGTSTELNDKYETTAIKTLFGEHASSVKISSTKSMIGHLLGAAGAVEVITTALTIKNGVITPTINYRDPDPECDLDYVPNKSIEAEINVAISNSFGFGGHNATILMRKY